MTHTKSLKKFKIAIFTLLIACFSLVAGIFINTSTVYAVVKPYENSSSKNLNFAYDNNSTIYTNPTGWTKGLQSATTSGSIKLTTTSYDSLYLTANQVPDKIQNSDDYALMINAKNKTDELPKNQYYENSSSFDLTPYSHYQIKVYVRVLKDSKASIKVTGLEQELKFDDIDYNDANTWTDYTFYISTGLNSESIKLQLWLGNESFASVGAVFFDNIEVNQISENEIKTGSRKQLVNYNNSKLLENINADFENKSLSDWSKITELTTNSYAEILDLSNNNESTAKEIPYLNTDLTLNEDKSVNKNALVLYTKENTKTHIALKSKNITLNMHDIVKITVNAKIADLDGNAYIKINENKVKNFKGEDLDSITPASNSITISSNTTNSFTNDYTTYTFLLKARSLYDSTYNIELHLGSDETLASGIVAFDNIKIENISYSDYTNQSTSSSVVKMELETDPNSYSIKNSAFNQTQKENANLTYPLLPADWTQITNNKNDVYYGVINTLNSIYDANKDSFGGFANPGNPEGFGNTSNETNNILMMQNINETYQQLTSSSFEIAASSYYKLTFNYKLIQTGLSSNLLSLNINDDEKNVLYADETISVSNNSWQTYTVYLNTKAYSNKLNLIFNLGTKTNLVQGLLYLDNVILTKLDIQETEYEELAKSNNVLDFQEGNFNLIKDGEDGIFVPLRYTSSLVKGENPTNGDAVAIGGIIDVENEQDAYENIEKSPNSTSSLNYIMMLQTLDYATYTLTAKDYLSLTSGSYYKFSVDIKTQGIKNPLNNDKNEKYGAIFALNGIEEKIEGVVCEDWTTYSIYVACTSSADIRLSFGIASLDASSSGNVFFDNYTYETIDKDTYSLAKLDNENEDNFLFIGDTDASEEEGDKTTSADLDYIWYLIPSLILVVALVIAIVASLMKKVKIKKWEKRKINEYDRDKTVHRDLIRKQAEDQRDQQIKEIKQSISELENEKQRIEEIHETQVKNSRANRSQGISREAEKEFKQYAKLRTAIENRIISANKQIDNLNTAEYLLSLQHKIIIEKTKEERKARETAFKKDKLKKSKKNK